MKNRILALDGWRTIASLGVVWIHTWTFCGNPALKLLGVNIFQPLAILGNGVDFFFVISGFCLYLILKDKPITASTYKTFIKNRWLRIGPAFYICATVALFAMTKVFNVENLKLLFYNFSYLNNIIPYNGNANSSITPPFWSLAVEFQFYILLPFMLMASSKIGIKKTLYTLFALGLCMNFIFTADENKYHLVTKVCHFTLGIFAAVIFLEKKVKPQILTQYWGLFLGIIAMFFGRYTMSDAYVHNANNLISLFSKALGPIFLVGGFTLVMLNTITSEKTGKWLANPVLQFYGKISYSVYLWHYFLLSLVLPYLQKISIVASLQPVFLFLMSMLVITPVSYASYYFIERLYLNKKK